MRRHGVLITLLTSYVAMLALAALLYFRLRPRILAAFEEFGTPIPWGASLALSRWLLPGAAALSALLAFLSASSRLRRVTRRGLLSAAVVVLAAALLFAAWATFEPLFQPAF